MTKGTGLSALGALEALSKLAEHDAKLDRLSKLGELAKRRLAFWRGLALISAGATIVLGVALWQSVKRCPCVPELPEIQGLEDQSLKRF